MSEIIRLSCGACKASIRPLGAQIISLTAPDGHEVIWQADPAVWADHSPILFPIIGNAKDGSVIIDGVSYPISKHGFARKAMFTPIEVTESTAVLELTENEDTLEQYPFAFSLQVKYELTENGFGCRFRVENRSDKPMPFCVGGHPAFVVPMEEGADFTDYHLYFPEDTGAKNLLCPGGQLISGSEELTFENHRIALSHDIFDEKDTLLLPELKSREICLVHHASGHGIRFTRDGMEAMAFWSHTGTHGDYLCMEPWHGLPGMVNESGVFAEKRYATVLKPGEVYDCGFEAELI